MEKPQQFTLGKIVTIPNILSLLRICLIPLILILYLRGYRWYSAGVVLLSFITDVVDGYIARRFNMTSELGKALDPAADKLTQLAISLCLISSYPIMAVLAVTIFVKELATGLGRLVLIRRTGKMYSAAWHGKIATAMIYLTVMIHILWADMPPAVSTSLTALTCGLILLSLILYALDSGRKIVKARKEKSL